MFHYLKTYNHTFSSKPFNAVDGALLSWVSYLKIYNFPREGVTLKKLFGKEVSYDLSFRPAESKKMLFLMSQSPRFASVAVSDYRETEDEQAETRFAAMALRIEEELYFLVFRGTDPSFLAWKEDFNMAYTYPLPSQVEALEYTRQFLALHPRAKVILGGHSKGGTLAVYVRLHLSEEYALRVQGVYTYDDPGFLCEPPQCDNVYKFIPQSSFVGIMFHSGQPYTVVKSRAFLFIQHDIFTWKVKNVEFVSKKKLTRSAQKLSRTFNGWVEGMETQERKRFVAIVFNALYKLDTRDFNVFFASLIKQIPKLMKEHKNLSSDDKQFFDEEIKDLLHRYFHFKKSKEK